MYGYSANREDPLMQDCMNPTMKNSYSDIDYAFHGYNIYRAYPKENGRDPGYTHKLFEAVYGDVEYFRQVNLLSAVSGPPKKGDVNNEQPLVD